MTDSTNTADWLTQTETLEEDVEILDREVTIEVQSVTISELESLGEDAADEFEEMQAVLDEYLVSVDGASPPPGEEIGIRKLSALFQGMQSAWVGSGILEAAGEEMPLDKGNR